MNHIPLHRSVETQRVNPGIIRQFRDDDLDTVVRIANSSMTEYYTRNLILEISREWPNAFLVCTVKGRIVGFITGSKYTRTEARILLLAVEEGFRNSGYGSALMREFLSVCKENEMMSVRLEVKTDNESAIRFYRGFKFVITNTLSNYYSDSSDAYLMWRLL